ncbi:TetR/AcrR family transcriptional regulator [Frankia sp. CNm7]|uniref:TetR/AcrR family transcriptional regulator n=1 Tax=Frankia nepalensis TaxID=1836974 RepID=A0A937RKQ0_9ACTN|nr:TetR/AcrR family transcriptional regulator [Frankia nepalensis]MBL7501860.1 TetR/AcrR family transcriptional regulator [Frankia nepalensis]MBL7513804.1 TetR/AcrR family transcriptional regulator [Frankia nepalensis]MBL7519981.1 TetR/AcrR family transcriptional regulator [Frankia nepalensis]MBL7629109.1 TetR/AcrR family transcriptional regulator [Frankia nepalensis]
MGSPVHDRPSRAEKTRQTRRRIVAAAADLFLDQGYGATTLDQVAARAGVAVQTVYFHFGNKATLLKEALDVAAVGDDEPVALLDRPWLEELAAEPDPVRVIELWTTGGLEIMGRVAPLLAVVRGTVGTDPDLAAQWDVNEGQRRTAFRALAGLLADRAALRPGLTVEDAADLAFLITSAENYLVATGTLGWSPQRWRSTTATLLARALLGDDDAAVVTRRW